MDGYIGNYDGTQKIIDAKGNLVGTFTGKEYLDFISERVQPWTYLKFPYQKKLGDWKGIVEGPDTNCYAVGPMALFNLVKGMDTPKAQKHFEKYHAAFGGKPVHNILACATHAVTGAQVPVQIDVFDSKGGLYKTLTNF
ncbi:hypothetical protein [uncultured Desulfobacter sp.]|uniref:hypothetical protein n=1 Tax=uncultured Desulfobacter sp. TaxID=240139 RepID=UPI0029F56211|nr:hypothetical protein [uncultured Desulfobacter sp.]